MENPDHTYAGLHADPSPILGLRSDTAVKVACTGCGTVKRMLAFRVKRALLTGQSGFFCSKSCRGRFLFDAKINTGGIPGGHLCALCGLWKSRAEYPHSPSRKGMTRTCTLCAYRKPKNKYKEYQQSAAHRNHEFKLSYVEFMHFWRVPCHYCEGHIETVGLDRLDNSVGYIEGNVISCCETCNKMKYLDTYDGFLARCRAIAENHPC